MPSGLSEALADLGRFLDAVGPYVDDLVLIGGWTPYFYRFLPDLRRPDHEPILTKDFDLVSPGSLPERGTGTLDERLRAAGFVVHESRDPVVLRYQDRRFGARDLAPIHFEFLTTLTGPARGRRGQARQTRDVKRGLPAQALRYLDLLRHEPLIVRTAEVPGLRRNVGVDLRIPNPAAYVFQKALVHEERDEKAAKDLAYVYDVALLWSGKENEVLEMSRSLAAESATWATWLGRARRTLDGLFIAETSDGPVAIEREMRAASVARGISSGNAFRLVRPFLEGALGLAPGRVR